MARDRRAKGAITTWVCLTCGAEIFGRPQGGGAAGAGEAAASPRADPSGGPAAGAGASGTAGLVCARCGGRVFREFDTPAPRDQVARDYLEDTAREVELGDPSSGAGRSELRDLEQL